MGKLVDQFFKHTNVSLEIEDSASITALMKEILYKIKELEKLGFFKLADELDSELIKIAQDPVPPPPPLEPNPPFSVKL